MVEQRQSWLEALFSGPDGIAILMWSPSKSDVEWAALDKGRRAGLLDEQVFSEKISTVGHVAMVMKVDSSHMEYTSFWPDPRRGRNPETAMWFGRWHSFDDDLEAEARYPDETVRLENFDAQRAFYFDKVIDGVSLQAGLSRLAQLRDNPPKYHAKGAHGGHSCSTLVKDVLEEVVNVREPLKMIATSELMDGLKRGSLGVKAAGAVLLPFYLLADVLADNAVIFWSTPARAKRSFKESRGITPNFFKHAFSPTILWI